MLSFPGTSKFGFLLRGGSESGKGSLRSCASYIDRIDSGASFSQVLIFYRFRCARWAEEEEELLPAMERRKRVLELRDRMDRTLALPDLADEASLRALVKKQILASALPGGSDEGLGSVYFHCLLMLLLLTRFSRLRNLVLVVGDGGCTQLSCLCSTVLHMSVYYFTCAYCVLLWWY